MCVSTSAGHLGRSPACSGFMNRSVSRKSASTRHENTMRTKKATLNASRSPRAFATNAGSLSPGAPTMPFGAWVHGSITFARRASKHEPDPRPSSKPLWWPAIE